GTDPARGGAGLAGRPAGFCSPRLVADRYRQVSQHRRVRSAGRRPCRALAGGRLFAAARWCRDDAFRGDPGMIVTAIRPRMRGTLPTLTWYETRRYVRSPVLFFVKQKTAYEIYD